MKKLLTFATALMLTIGAMAQVNAVGIPFGISKVKAVDLLKSKYGDYAHYSRDAIIYVGFRLDGIEYETATFSFDKNLLFSKATFSMPKRSLQNSDAAIADLNKIVAELEKRYMVVNLVEFGANQSRSDANGTISTLYRAMPKDAAKVEHSFMITIFAYANENGMTIHAAYEPKDVK